MGLKSKKSPWQPRRALCTLAMVLLFWGFAPEVWGEQTSRLHIDGLIMDHEVVHELQGAGSLAEFTAIICTEDAATGGLKMIWSMDDTGGPDCVLNPPETGVFTEVKNNNFSLLLGGPSQNPLPTQLPHLKREDLKIFLFVSVNDDEWKLIMPFDHQLAQPLIPTIPGKITVSMDDLSQQPFVAQR